MSGFGVETLPTGVLGLRLGMRQTKGFGQRPFYTLLWFSFYTLLWYFVLHFTWYLVLHFAVVPRSRFYILLWYLVLHFAVVLWYLVLHLL